MAGRWMILACVLTVAAPAAAQPLTLERCDERVRREPDNTHSYYCYVQAAHATGRLEEAAARLEAILQVRPNLYAARMDLAFLEQDLGRDHAEASYLEVIAGMEKTGDVKGIVYARTGLASFLDARQRHAEAEPHLARALEVAEQSGDAMLLAHAQVKAAVHADDLLDYGRALGLYRKAEATVFPDGPYYLKDWVLSGLGSVYWALGEDALALATYQRDAELSREAGNLYLEAMARYNAALLAVNLWQGGGLSQAQDLRLINEAIEAAVAGGNRETEASTRLMLAEALMGDEGKEQIDRALALLKPRKYSEDWLFARRLLADWTFEQGPVHHEEALRLVASSIEDARNVASRHSEARALILRAAMLRRIGRDRESIISAHLEALDAVERIRDLQPEGSIRARSFSKWLFVYNRLISYLLDGLDRSPDPEANMDLAFRTMERVRSRVLLDTLDGAGVTAVRAASPEGARRQSVLSRIQDVQSELLHPDLTPARRAERLERLKQLEAEEASIRDEMARTDSRSLQGTASKTPALSEVRDLLGPGRAMILFALQMRAPTDSDAVNWDYGRSWAISITADGARAFPVPDLQALQERVEVYRGLIERRDASQREAATRLYDDLLADPIAALPERITRLVIVPDAILGTLPFETLLSPSGRFLAEDFEISYAPSATLWARWRRVPSAPKDAGGVLGVADPAVGSGDGGERGQSIDPWAGGLHLGPLPHAAREAEVMVSRLGGDGLLLEGADAREASVKSADFTRYDVLHLAAHAIVDEDRPERSAIVLARSGENDDGLLQFREIVDLDLKGKLLILSACQSARGEAVLGEGVMSLARAFFEAGSRTVVGSLLPLRDDETASLMDGFSRGLAGGRSVAGALAEARRAMIASGSPPAAWAGLVVLGDGDLVPRPRGGTHGLLPVEGLALAVSVLVLVVWLRRRRHGTS